MRSSRPVKVLEVPVTASLREALFREGLFEEDERWRLSPEPLYIPEDIYREIESLGPLLLSFYRALNRLYFMSIKGEAPGWVSEYLDMGKPEYIVKYGRMNRFKTQLPVVIRPDLIPIEDGLVATELDSVPGGIGITALLSSFYDDPVGGKDGMVEGFMEALRSLTGGKDPVAAIVVSEESRDYRPEMGYVARRLTERGLKTHILKPQDLTFTEEGLWAGKERVHILYRFFELFDIVNIPKAELFLYAAKKKRVILTPPPKAFLEEKLSYALFHHPGLRGFWTGELGEEGYKRLTALFPKTWVLDPRPLPPHGVIPGIEFRGEGVGSWDFLKRCTQKERRYVIKPSGFCEEAWGGRGITVGHDVALERWSEKVDEALSSFHHIPHILQEFRKGKRWKVRFERKGRMEEMEGRARLTPYYFVTDKGARLSGILATICPSDKKVIHGMKDAVMTVCAVRKT